MKKIVICLLFALGLAQANVSADFASPSLDQIKEAANTPRKLIDLIREANDQQRAEVVVATLQMLQTLDYSEDDKRRRMVALIAIAITMAGEAAPTLAATIVQSVAPANLAIAVATAVAVAGEHAETVQAVVVASVPAEYHDQVIPAALDPISVLGKGDLALLAAGYARVAYLDPYVPSDLYQSLGPRPLAHIEPEGEEPKILAPLEQDEPPPAAPPYEGQ